MNEVKGLKKRAEFYLGRKITVHIETNSSRFYNGLILEIHRDHIILIDRMLGEILISYTEISVFEKFKWGNGR